MFSDSLKIILPKDTPNLEYRSDDSKALAMTLGPQHMGLWIWITFYKGPDSDHNNPQLKTVQKPPTSLWGSQAPVSTHDAHAPWPSTFLGSSLPAGSLHSGSGAYLPFPRRPDKTLPPMKFPRRPDKTLPPVKGPV